MLIFLFPFAMIAQILPQERNYKIGIKTGLNFSTLNVSGVINERTRTGLNLGIFFKQQITDQFAVQPELLFSAKGSELRFNERNFLGTAKVNLNYLDLPVLLVYNPTSFFNVHLGPYLGVLLWTNVKTVNQPIPEEPFFDLGEQITGRSFGTFDVGIAAGMGIEIGVFNAGMRYNFGLADIGQRTIVFGRNYGFPDAKNHLAQLYVGVAF